MWKTLQYPARVNTDAQVDFDGFEISLHLPVTPGLSLDLDFTGTNAEPEGSSEQVADILRRQPRTPSWRSFGKRI